jgi:hypothetical protein
MDRAAGGASGGDAAVPPTVTRVRFLHAFTNDVNGTPVAPVPYDVWRRDPDQTWVSVYKGLTYATVTDYVSVSVRDGKEQLWFVPPGSDPAMAPADTGGLSRLIIAAGDTGRHTSLIYNVGGSVSVTTFLDDDPLAKAPTGKALIYYYSGAIISRWFPGIGVRYGRDGLCLGEVEALWTPVDPGTWAFGVYEFAGGNCPTSPGKVVAATAPITYAAGDAWRLYAIGDRSPNGFKLIPVKIAPP